MRLVYLSPVPWTSFAQRPHHFARWFHARSNGEILWIDPYPTRLPSLADFRRAGVASDPQCCLPDWLTVLRPRALPVEPLAGSGHLHSFFWDKLLNKVDAFVSKEECRIGVGKPSELALQVLGRTADQISFYDAMDDFPAFYSGLSRRAMKKREHHLASTVNKILVSSSALLARFAYHGGKVTLALNACSTDRLPPVEKPTKPSDLMVIGYVGTIGNWFDWALVFAIARQNPAGYLRLIGPVYLPPPDALPDNVQLLPPCDHETAISAMREFSIGLIPFKRTELTASVDPIKYYEYRALGIPVLSTSFGEMALRSEVSGVFLMDESADLRRRVETALAYHCEMNEIRAFRDANSWEARFNASGIFP